jgi:LysM repeat protein
MKNSIKKPLIKAGLAGILLGTSILPSFAQKHQKQERPYLSNTFHGVEYSDRNPLENRRFALEKQVLLGKYNTEDIPVILTTNPDIQEGELPFIMYSLDQAELINGYGRELELNGIKYIPTRLIDKEDRSILRDFILTEISAELKKTIKKKKKNSENSFGYSINLTDEDIISKLPQLKTPNGEIYVYFDLNWGKIYNQKGEIMYPTQEMYDNIIPKLFVPIKDKKNAEIINLWDGKISIFSAEGFYLPMREEVQAERNPVKQMNENPSASEISVNDASISPEDEPREKSDYELYIEKLEKEREYFSARSQNKHVKYNSQTQDTIKPSEKKDSAVYHIIQKGDTFYKLADEYWGTGKQADEIQKLNPGVNPDSLKIGQKIRVR